MDTQIVEPRVSNFVKSLRDIGYNFEIAVAVTWSSKIVTPMYKFL